MASSPNLHTSFPFSQEVAISADAHGDLRTTMLDMADNALLSEDTVRDWHIRGVPIKNAALVGHPDYQRKGVEYHYMDMLMSSRPNDISIDPECAISFHGHALDYSMEAILDPDDRFSIYPDYGRSKHGMVPNKERHSGIDKQEMFTFLFKLLGHKAIPEAIQHPDSPDFSTRHALESLMAQVAATEVSSRETIADYVSGVALIGNESGLFEVGTTLARIREERPNSSETLRLVARTAVIVWEGVSIRKQLSYKFRKSDILDGDSTSARLHLSLLAPADHLDPRDVHQMVEHTLRSTEESFSHELMNAAKIIPPTASQVGRLAS